MSVIAEALERENLDIMKELFDCKVEDLSLARYGLACAHPVLPVLQDVHRLGMGLHIEIFM
jgi:hypothetical protein